MQQGMAQGTREREYVIHGQWTSVTFTTASTVMDLTEHVKSIEIERAEPVPAQVSDAELPQGGEHPPAPTG